MYRIKLRLPHKSKDIAFETEYLTREGVSN